MLRCAHYTLNYMYHHGTPCINNHKWLRLHSAEVGVHTTSCFGQLCQDSRKQVLHVITLYTKAQPFTV